MHGCGSIRAIVFRSTVLLIGITEVDVVEEVVVVVILLVGTGSSKLMQAFQKILAEFFWRFLVILGSDDKIR
ncbi:MAG: hypothetical protein ACR2RE_26920 [Geminicoccaceae bacterium]